MKHFDGIYTVSVEETLSARSERQYRRVVWLHPLISVLLAAGVVAVFSFNGLVA